MTTATQTPFESALTHRPLTLPDGRPAVIRKLNWTQLKAAAKAQTSESLAVMREMGAELIRAFRTEKDAAGEEAVERIEKIQKAQSRKPSQYEQATTLLDGIVEIDGKSEIDVQGLDAPAAEFLHEAIVAYAWEVPGKNALSTSTSISTASPV